MPHSDDLEELCPCIHINTPSMICHTEKYSYKVNGLNNAVDCLIASEGQALYSEVSCQALTHMSARGEVLSDSLNGGVSATLTWQDSVPGGRLDRELCFLTDCWLEAAFCFLPRGPPRIVKCSSKGVGKEKA